MKVASNLSIPRIVADVKSIPPLVEPMATEWSAAIPPGARLADMTALAPERAKALVSGSDAATRSEIGTLDNALGTNCARFLPAPTSASMRQRPLAKSIAKQRPARTPRYSLGR